MDKQIAALLEKVEACSQAGDPRALGFLLANYRKALRRSKSKVDVEAELKLLAAVDAVAAKCGWQPDPKDEDALAAYFIHNDWEHFAQSGARGLAFLLENLETPGIQRFASWRETRLATVGRLSQGLSPTERATACDQVQALLAALRPAADRSLHVGAWGLLAAGLEETDLYRRLCRLTLRDFCAQAKASPSPVRQAASGLLEALRQKFLGVSVDKDSEQRIDTLFRSQPNYYSRAAEWARLFAAMTEFELFDPDFVTHLSQAAARARAEAEEEDTSDGGVTSWQLNADWILAAEAHKQAYERTQQSAS